MSLLSVEGLTVRFGGLTAVDGLTMAVERGTVHGLIGPNGAGKTTAFNLISGLTRPTSGHVGLEGRSLDGLPTYARTRAGLARTFQNIRMFASMTVLETVMAGMHSAPAPGLLATLARTPAARRAEREAVAAAVALLDLVGLSGDAGRRAGDLPYGGQRRLEIARALACGPALLMLDEPAAGMNPSETVALMELLRGVRERGVTLLLVEHDMHFVMRLCDTITVLNFGRVIARGAPAQVRADPVVVEAYLGAKVARSLAEGDP